MRNFRLYNANPPSTPTGGQPPTTPSATPAAPVTPPAETAEAKRIKELEGHLAEYQKTNNALLTKVAQLTPAPTKPQPTAQPNPTDARSKWWTDPEQAFQERAAPLVQSMTNTQYYLVREQMKNKYPKEFKLWEPEIDELVKPLNPMFLTDPQTWEIIIERVRGRHVMDYAKDPSLVPGYSESVSPADPPGGKPANQQLTERELKVAKSLGITPEKYLAQKKNMTVGV